jgi:F-type H+-transporting ATPase subunit a
MLIVTVLIISSLDNKGAGIINFLRDGDNTVNIYLVYSTLLLLVVLNLISLIPRNIVIRTSIPRFVFGGFFVFFVMNVVSILVDLKMYIVNFVPSGAPLVLLPVLYIIEVVSYIMRPLALIVRICVNMFCRHMLLLLGRFSRLPTILIIVILLEFGVAVVQGYVYAIILML